MIPAPPVRSFHPRAVFPNNAKHIQTIPFSGPSRGESLDRPAESVFSPSFLTSPRCRRTRADIVPGGGLEAAVLRNGLAYCDLNFPEDDPTEASAGADAGASSSRRARSAIRLISPFSICSTRISRAQEALCSASCATSPNSSASSCSTLTAVPVATRSLVRIRKRLP